MIKAISDVRTETKITLEISEEELVTIIGALGTNRGEFELSSYVGSRRIDSGKVLNHFDTIELNSDLTNIYRDLYPERSLPF